MRSTRAQRKGKNGLEPVVSLLATVHRGERLTAFLLATNVFILLMAYYIIKPVREALILNGAGAEVKSYAGAGQALLFLVLIPLYGAYASRTNRVRLINGVTAFFISNLAIFYFLSRAQVAIGVAFFLWVGLFNLMLVAQFWGFANDIYTEEQGKRLFAIVGVGSSIGAIVGARVAGWLFKPIGPQGMMLVAAGLLLVCMMLTNWIHQREGGANRGGSRPLQPIGRSGGFRLVLRHRYLLLVALMVLLLNCVNTTGEFILGKTVSEYAKSAPDSQAYIGEFYAEFFFWVNLIGAALQMFAVSRILKHVGVGGALFFLPFIALGSYTLLAFAPILPFIRIAKIAENSTDYSIENTARHALFLRTSRDAKYKAQAAIESFFWRAGDAMSAVLVFAGTRFALDISKFAIVNMILVFLWLAVTGAIIRQRKNQDAAEERLAA